RFDTLSKQMEAAAMELQSDYLGGFLAYSAGYGSFTQGDELIRRLYKEFALPDEVPGYVTRSEREDMSRRSAQKMKDLVEIFDMANLLTATEQYEDAFRYYRKVLVEYQSRELYNNVGAAALMHAMKNYFNADDLKFRYPIQVDLEIANSRGAHEDSIRTNLLRQAVQHFDAAISLDPDYAPAYLNKACALALLGDQVRAYYFADVEARNASKGVYAGNMDMVEILLGILDATAGTADGKVKAMMRFTAADVTDKSGLAAYNLAVLNNTPLPAAPADPGSKKFFDDESIDGQDLSAMLYPDDDKMLPIDETLTFFQHTALSKNSRLYFNRRSGNVSILFQATTTSNPGETARGIKIGNTRVDIEKKYGPAPRNILTPNGQIMAYPDILFVMKNDMLERWILVKKF
ncbi:MAG TPA: tetratricopeptide repeat protein, partial [Saprospiraceae bacterium]|nr:tetratricopeptide repeat protein [Saprospiraceae bacterium]